jgi:hypothetical protein
MQYDVFISYARKDGDELASRLERDLIAASMKTWRDRRQLDPNQDFSAELEHGIDQSTQVVCCVTPDTRRGDSFVRREIAFAMAVNKPIVPIIFEDTLPPIHVINITREDFTHVPWQLAFSKLLARLRRYETSANHQGTPPSDPFRSYLNALYLQIVDFLGATVFSEIILRSDESIGAVDRPRRTALPMAFWRTAPDSLAPTLTGPPACFPSFASACATLGSRVLLLGDPGSGKTTTLFAFARDRIAARLHDSRLPLPLLAPISTWDSEKHAPLPDWLAEQISMLDRDTIESEIRAANAFLLLDGLDELPSGRIDKEGKHYDPRKKFIAQIPTEGAVVVACRVKDYAEIGTKIKLTGAVTLRGLSDDQICEYLAKMPILWDALIADDGLRDLARTPLLLALLRRAYQHNASALGDLRNLNVAPARLRDRIFDAYIRSRFAHEQERANAELPFSVDDIYQILGAGAIDGVEYVDSGHSERGIPLEEAIMRRLAGRAVAFAEQMIRLNLVIRKDAQGLIFIHSLLRNHFALRSALLFHDSHPEFKESDRLKSWDLRCRTLQFLAESGDERAVEPLLQYLQPYIDFPLVYSLHIADPQVLLAYARSLSIDTGDPKYDYVSDGAWGSIKIVSKKLGASESALALSTAIRISPPTERANYVYALGVLELTEGLHAALATTQDDDPTVRACAIYALAAIGDPKATAVVVPLLDDDHEVKKWNNAPWSDGARVKDIARAALGRRVGEDRIRSWFPSKLRERIVHSP